MKRVSHRTERVAELLRETIAEYLRRATDDPRLASVTVTRAEVTRDLSVATVWVSALGDDQAKRRVLEGLEHARGYLRSHLARALRLRQVPALRFELDRGLDHALRIEAILAELRRAGEDR